MMTCGLLAGLHRCPIASRATRSGRRSSFNLASTMFPKRRAVEKYKDATAWSELTDAVREELLDEVAPLPSEVKGESEEAKRFASAVRRGQ